MASGHVFLGVDGLSTSTVEGYWERRLLFRNESGKGFKEVAEPERPVQAAVGRGWRWAIWTTMEDPMWWSPTWAVRRPGGEATVTKNVPADQVLMIDEGGAP